MCISTCTLLCSCYLAIQWLSSCYPVVILIGIQLTWLWLGSFGEVGIRIPASCVYCVPRVCVCVCVGLADCVRQRLCLLCVCAVFAACRTPLCIPFLLVTHIRTHTNTHTNIHTQIHTHSMMTCRWCCAAHHALDLYRHQAKWCAWLHSLALVFHGK